MIYEPLVQYNLVKGSVTYPFLATKWALSNGNKTLTVTLRSGVKWTDGQPFTSADVVFTFNMLKEHPALNINGITFSSVAATGPYGVVFNFATSAYVESFYILGNTYIVPQHIWKSVNPTTFTDTKPVGTGPFILSQFTPQGFLVTKNPHYWMKGKPAIGGIRFVAYDTNNTANLALEHGQLSWAGNNIVNVQKLFVANSKYNVYWGPINGVIALWPNLTVPGLNDVNVRQAMSLAINRQAISTVGESGTEPTATNVVGIIPAFSNYLLPQYAHPDLSVQDDKAIALLKAAGYTQGSDGVMANSKGTKLAYSCEDPGPYEDYTTDCALIKADLQKIGIAVTVKAVSVNQWAADLTSGNFQLSVHWDSPNGPSPYFQMLAWLDSTYGAPIGKTATWDFERWNDPATQTLISQFENATSDSERQTAIQGLEKIMAEQVPVIPLVFGAYFAEANESQVAGWPGPANPYAPLSPYDPVDEVVALNLVPR